MNQVSGVVCSNLFSTDDARTSEGRTQAIKELTLAAKEKGLPIDAVIRVSPIISKKSIGKLKRQIYKGIVVNDVPIVGFWFLYNKFLTDLLIRKYFVYNYTFAICHYARNVLFIKKHFPGIKKIIFIMHNTDFHPRNRNLTCEAVNCSDAVFTRSQALNIRLSEEFDITADGVVFSGIAEEIIVENSTANEYSSGPIKLISACSLIGLKNVDKVIRAVLILKNKGYQARLDICGDGPLKDYLITLVKELGLIDQVVFHGFLPRQTVLEKMRESNVFLMPSAPETLGLAFLESMASGCVVVGHRGWGIDGIIKDGVDGFLVNSPTPEEIAHKVITYVGSDVASLHQHSLAKARMYTKSKAVDNYMEHVFRALRQ